jgi:hypothetical protein
MLRRVAENFETLAHRGFTLEIGQVTGFRARKPKVGKPRADGFSGIHLVPVKNRRWYLKARMA